MRKHSIKFKDKNDPRLRDYDIHIDFDILPRVLEYVKKNISNKRQVIVTDQNVVDAGHLKRLDPKEEVPTFVVEPDKNKGVESKKNNITYGEIGDFLDKHKFEKRDTLICFGGGVLGDMGGFAAGTYKRGPMTYIQLPTTTISQYDSSVGGKCAIDSLYSKNAFGTIYQPHFVAQDISSLFTLDDRNYNSGHVESAKHGIIFDEDLLVLLENNIEGINSRDRELLEEIAYNNVRLKGSVVVVDPHEMNERRCLNFGHTLGHAIEIVSDFKLYHGEAIGLGIIGASHISNKHRGLSTKEFDRIQEFLINKLKMPSKVPDYVNRDKVIDTMASDKKVVDGVPYFVTIDGIGKLHVENDQYAAPIPKNVLKEALDYIF